MGVRILVVDDERSVCRILDSELCQAGFSVQTANDGVRALDILRGGEIDVVILDINMPGMDGFHLLKNIRQLNFDALVIMITAFGSIESAVHAMQLGANDYITKPFESSQLADKITQLMRVRQRASQSNIAKREDPAGEAFCGYSEGFRALQQKADRIKNAQATVLITGESGTGKGVLARYIHNSSVRRALPFVHVDCASIPENLIESELFGHEKGAFTGAAALRRGKFESAGEGTIFLDEIGALPMQMQKKLLVVLQDRTVNRLGGDKPIYMPARVIAATNERLELLVRTGQFREDLYYRLCIVELSIPPLRERPDDIAFLAEVFLESVCRGMGIQRSRFTPEVMALMKKYTWPGNIRELRNAVESAVLLSESAEISAACLPLRILENSTARNPADARPRPLSDRENEMLALMNALKNNAGHREKTARELGISRRTLQYRLKKYGLLAVDFRAPGEAAPPGEAGALQF